jgi:hypothetical protein
MNSPTITLLLALCLPAAKPMVAESTVRIISPAPPPIPEHRL